MPTTVLSALDRRRRFSLLAAGLAASLAVIGLAGFILRSAALASLGSAGVPMAPATAVCLLLLAAAVIARWTLPPESARPKVLAASYLTTAITAGAALTQRYNEAWAMSPLAGLFLIFLASGQLRLARRHPGRDVLRFALFALSFSGGFLFLMGYLYEAPFLYTTGVRPVAMPTAAALCLLAGSHLAADDASLALAGLSGNSLHALLLRNFLPLPFGGVIAAGLLYRSHHAFPINPALIHWLAFIFSIALGWIFIYRAGNRTQAALREAESKYRMLYETSRDALVVACEPSWIFCAGNHAAVLLFGAQDEAHLLAHGPVDLSPPRQPDGRASETAAKERIEQTLRTGTAHFEWTHRRIDGTAFPAEVLLTAFELDGKKAIQASIRDLTELRRQQAFLVDKTQEIHKLFRLVEQSPALVLLTDTAGRIEYVNSKFCETTGYTFDEVRGKNPRILKGGEVPPEEYKRLWDSLKSGREWRGVLHNRKKNGEMYWASAVICPIKDSAGRITHFAGLQEDITQSRSLRDQLVQAQKMEAVGRLAGGVAHDFNNLLTIILGYCKLLLKQFEEADPRLGDISEIQGAAIRAAGLTSRLLAFSRRQVLSPRVLDLNETLRGFHTMMSRLVGEEMNLVFALADALWKVRADSAQLEQVVMNLVVNARDAMPKGGKITVRTLNAEVAQEDRSAHDVMPPGSYVLLEVSDTGAGMSESTLSHLFEPFFTTKEKGKGTGLGLSTAFGIVKQSAGYIRVESRLNAGTVFRVYLPRTEEPAEAPSLPRTPGDTKARGANLLVVDDEEPIRKMLSRILREAGYHILEACDGQDGLDLFKKDGGKIDLILSDIVMPRLGGRALAGEIKALRPEVPVILMSGYTGQANSPLEASDGLFLQKPIAAETLLAEVRKALGARRETA